ncbi:GNAT family N-acetyltransferase [Phyllobacterium sp. TAF24]|uniref:GNAT family N-acetyltransferase n=1 Tax=Phyllobacterium sp. TAF24 TaxID=3233068 RepID=UPI003F9D671B
MNLMVESVVNHREAIVREVLDDLQEWFWNPEYRASFAESAETLPMFACYAVDGSVMGFITVKPTSDYAVEIYLMGVKRRWHRAGAGRALIQAAENFAISLNAKFITVKTIGTTHPSAGYQDTRKFYESLGFLPLEESELYWGENWPCLFLIRPISIL